MKFWVGNMYSRLMCLEAPTVEEMESRLLSFMKSGNGTVLNNPIQIIPWAHEIKETEIPAFVKKHIQEGAYTGPRS